MRLSLRVCIMNNRIVFIGLQKNTEYNDYTNGKNVVVKLSNGEDKGYQYSFNAILTKKYDFGFTGSIGYTYTMAKDLTANSWSALIQLAK